MMMTNIETEVTPALGGEKASEEIMGFLLQGFDGDVSRIWESNIFGKSLYDIAEEGLEAKIKAHAAQRAGKAAQHHAAHSKRGQRRANMHNTVIRRAG